VARQRLWGFRLALWIGATLARSGNNFCGDLALRVGTVNGPVSYPGVPLPQRHLSPSRRPQLVPALGRLPFIAFVVGFVIARRR
jgi:hypothetical protein